jgi:hypothetical protein
MNERKTTITVEGSLLPLVIIATGSTELEYARKNVRQAVSALREHGEENVASDLYQALSPFIGYV